MYKLNKRYQFNVKDCPVLYMRLKIGYFKPAVI